MPRKPREWIEGAVYHVFSRGSNRQAIFLGEGDLAEFDGLFHQAIAKHDLETYGWSWMPNHWHLLVLCPAAGLSSFVKQLNHRYALRFDGRWGRRAHVFEARFGAVLQTTEEQFLWTLRYILRNPVEAGLCASPFDARWTSFAATVGRTSPPAHLGVESILRRFGEQEAAARERFLEFVLMDGPAGPDPLAPLRPSTVAA